MYKRGKFRWRDNDDDAVDITWTQDLACLEVTVPMPDSATSKDVSCIFKTTSLDFCFFRGDKKRQQDEFGGTLLRSCQPEECTWQVWPVGATKDRKIKIIIVKADQERLWKSLFVEGEGPPLHDKDKKA